MRKKISELNHREIIYWVAKGEGLIDQYGTYDFGTYEGEECIWFPSPYTNPSAFSKHSLAYQPQTNWSQGGSIIKKKRIAIRPWSNKTWQATLHNNESDICAQYGDTPLFAAMRCYIAFEFGDTVPLIETGE